MEGERLFGHWQQQQQQGEPSMSEMGSTLSLSEQLHNPSFLHINWDHHNHSMEHQQSSQFESALSSMVSSPSNPNPSSHTDTVVIHELIGRLGSICNSSGDISPHANGYTTSCYSTPINSPPKLNLSTMDRRNLPICFPSSAPQFAPLSADPRFARIPPTPETGKLSRASSSKSLMASGSAATPEEAREESSVSGAVAAGESNGRKRKASHKANKDLPKVAGEHDGRGKKTRSLETNGKPKGGGGDEEGNRKNGKESTLKPPEPPKQDYIHVRARRGQATDSHSLAERVRREKISERMKFLQNLVPGCNKVTGKAVMLDEIINYVQSLQRQVEFLSMKLATLNPRLDINVDGLLQKDMLSQRGPLQQLGLPVDAQIPTLSFPFQQQPSGGSTLQSIGMEGHCAVNPIDAAVRPTFDGIGEAPPQVGTFWEDELNSFVQMNYGQNQEIPHTSQPIPGSLPITHMKVEL